jgi:hypothetical protein
MSGTLEPEPIRFARSGSDTVTVTVTDLGTRNRRPATPHRIASGLRVTVTVGRDRRVVTRIGRQRLHDVLLTERHRFAIGRCDQAVG